MQKYLPSDNEVLTTTYPNGVCSGFIDGEIKNYFYSLKTPVGVLVRNQIILRPLRGLVID